MKLIVEIELGTAAIATVGDIAQALHDVNKQVQNNGPMNTVLVLKDRKVGIVCRGYKVGTWRVEDYAAPAFNHTRADGPFDPCPQCLELMSREQLLAFAKDMIAVKEDS